MASASPALPKVRRVGRYLLGRRIGAGGMAAVFAARQDGPLDLGRLVAVKVMSTALVGDPAYENMFLREAGITARLEHPNIVRVYEVGEADGTLFIAMEFVHGPSLRELCMAQDEAPPVPIALRVVADVARALGAAHELCDAHGVPLGLVHQDVTPHNIMVTYGGVAKLLDFGVARIGALDASRTETIRGKPSYLAPEQVRGARIDRRTDVFALGIVLYELLTGERLFMRPTQAEMYDAVTKGIVPELAESVPAELGAVCRRALERDPDARFESASDFATALESARRVAGIAEASERELGVWANQLVPPELSLGALEREILRGSQSGFVERSDVADLPTLSASAPSPAASIESAPRASAAPESALPELPTSPRWPFLAVIPLLAALAALVWWLVPARGDVTVDTSASAATTATASITSAPSAPTAVTPVAPLAPTHSARSAATARATALASAPAAASSSAAAPPPPPPPVPSAVVAPARLAVRSTPWGNVIVDGVPVGQSPIVLATTPGAHTVTVRTPDGKQQSRGVTLKEGKTETVQFVF